MMGLLLHHWGQPRGADASVQGLVASVLHNLSGEPLGVGAPAPGQDRPRDVFTAKSLAIDCRVPAKLKAKIWAH